MKKQRTRVNLDIRAPQVRLIGADGESLGVVSNDQAKRAAEAAGMDLVEVAANSSPPVVRIMDYGKFLFEEKKKRRNKSARIKVKEIKFRPNTDVGDYGVKLRNLMNFLEAGDKVKVTIRFRGREIAHNELGMDLLKRVEADVGANAIVEQRPKFEGRQMIMVLAPNRNKRDETPEAGETENAE